MSDTLERSRSRSCIIYYSENCNQDKSLNELNEFIGFMPSECKSPNGGENRS